MEVRSKIGIVVIAIVMLVGSVLGVYLVKMHKKDNELEISKHSLLLANALINLRTGDDKTEALKEKSKEYFNKTTLSEIANYKRDLENLDNVSFNVTEYVKKNGLDKLDDPIRDAMNAQGITDLQLVADDVPDDRQSQSTEEKISDDTRLYDKNGEKLIKVNDMKFNEHGADIIPYKGVNLQIDKKDVPQTYQNMKADKHNIYKYTTHISLKEENKAYIDVLYKNVYNHNKSILIRVFNNSKIITGFEVRK